MLAKMATSAQQANRRVSEAPAKLYCVTSTKFRGMIRSNKGGNSKDRPDNLGHIWREGEAPRATSNIAPPVQTGLASSVLRPASAAHRNCCCSMVSPTPATCSVTSSHFWVIVSTLWRPDLRGFGKSDMPGRSCTFHEIAERIDRFTEVVGLDRCAVHVFDYGAPTGFCLAVKHPDRITAIVFQNGNAYEEGTQ